MNKKIILKINDPNNMQYPVNGFILGLDDFSVGFNKTVDVSSIKKIRKEYIDKEIFVSLNRVVFNHELETYKSILKELDNIGLDGIIAGDVSILTYNLKTNIILDQMHLNNSYLSINHYYNNGCYGAYLTDDITLSEINEIKKNTKAKLFKLVFGYSILSLSKRKLVSNYKEFFNKDYDSSSYFICENNSSNYYPIVENNFGTIILSSKPINLLSIIDTLHVDYMVIDDYKINKDISYVIEAFVKQDKSLNKKIDDDFLCDRGFIDKETIYKVKYDE